MVSLILLRFQAVKRYWVIQYHPIQREMGPRAIFKQCAFSKCKPFNGLPTLYSFSQNFQAEHTSIN